MTSMRACIAQAKPCKMCMLGVLAHISSTFEFPRLVQCVKCGCYWQLICYKKCICGLEHGQPAQRTMSHL